MSRIASQLQERSLPYSIEAEKGVVGSVLLKPDFIDDPDVSKLRPDEFFDLGCRRIFEVMRQLGAESLPIDLAIVIERLKSGGQHEAIGGIPFIAGVVEAVPSGVNAGWYARIVRDYAIRRAAISVATEVIREAYTDADPSGLIGRAEQALQDAVDDRSNEAVQLSAAIVDTMDGINHRMENGAPPGLITGWASVDKRLGGIRNGELVIVAARPGMGKTSMALNLVDRVASWQEAGVLFVSLEMTRREVCERLLSGRAAINGVHIREARMTADERRRLIEASAELEPLQITIDDTPRRSILEISAQARRLKRKGLLDLLVIDYLTLIEPENPRDPRHEQVAKMSRRLKILARELEIPIIALSQLNRELEKGRDPRPKLAHLRESGAIEQDADVVMFVHRPEVYSPGDLDLRGKAELIIAKNRNADTGICHLTWEAETTRFMSVVSRGEEWTGEYGD